MSERQHLAPNGKDTHPGLRHDCAVPVCVNDVDDSVQLTPAERRAAGLEYHPRPVPLRREVAS